MNESDDNKDTNQRFDINNLELEEQKENANIIPNQTAGDTGKVNLNISEKMSQEVKTQPMNVFDSKQVQKDSVENSTREPQKMTLNQNGLNTVFKLGVVIFVLSLFTLAVKVFTIFSF